MEEELERLRSVREALGYNQHQMAEACGLSFSAYSCIERGLRSLKDHHLVMLAQNTDANIDYITKGEGDPLRHGETDRMTEMFHALDPERQALLIGLMESWLKK